MLKVIEIYSQDMNIYTEQSISWLLMTKGLSQYKDAVLVAQQFSV